MKILKTISLSFIALSMLLSFTLPIKQNTTVEEILSRSKLEVELAKQALETSTNGDISDYADRMIRDHIKMNNMLIPIASENNWIVPEELSPDHTNVRQSIQQKSGVEFDKAYIQQSIQNHQKLLSHIESISTDNEALLNWKKTNLPVIKGHLDMAKKLR